MNVRANEPVRRKALKQLTRNQKCFYKNQKESPATDQSKQDYLNKLHHNRCYLIVAQKEGTMQEVNNMVLLSGVLESTPTHSHSTNSIKFYSSTIRVRRLSKHHDLIPIVGKEELLARFRKGEYITISGEFRSRNLNGKVIVYVYIFEATTSQIRKNDINQCYISGFLCKKPITRATKKGRISDLCIAVNSGSRSDYLPCIVWNEVSDNICNRNVGAMIKGEGRIQSREYYKKNGTKVTKHSVTELSINVLYNINDVCNIEGRQHEGYKNH